MQKFYLQSPHSDCNLCNQTAISAIRLQSQQSDCNLSNWTAISAIRLQSQQSDCNLCNQKKTPPNMPESLCRVVARYVSCGTFAISAIRLQSPQSDCNLRNQTAILYCSQWIAFGLHREKDSIPGKCFESIGTWRSSGC